MGRLMLLIVHFQKLIFKIFFFIFIGIEKNVNKIS